MIIVTIVIVILVIIVVIILIVVVGITLIVVIVKIILIEPRSEWLLLSGVSRGTYWGCNGEISNLEAKGLV